MKEWDQEKKKQLMLKLLECSKLNNENGCLEWFRCRNNRGYGQMNINHKRYLTHRISYFLFNGDFDQNLKIMHSCDNPRCINPTHLKVGTQADNMMDMKLKGRHALSKMTHCKRNHEFKEGSYTVFRGSRRCKECLRITKARHELKKGRIKSSKYQGLQ